jgi:hypothetical protein
VDMMEWKNVEEEVGWSIVPCLDERVSLGR